jgi:hypothetical protein
LGAGDREFESPRPDQKFNEMFIALQINF